MFSAGSNAERQPAPADAFRKKFPGCLQEPAHLLFRLQGKRVDISHRPVPVQRVLNRAVRAVAAHAFLDGDQVPCADNPLPGANLILHDHLKDPAFLSFRDRIQQHFGQQFLCLHSIFLKGAGKGRKAGRTGFIISGFCFRYHREPEASGPAFDLLLQAERVVFFCRKLSEHACKQRGFGQFV